MVTRIALVTGATRGIGAAIADALESDCDEVRRIGKRILLPQVQHSITLGVNVLVNCGGHTQPKGLHAIDDDDWVRMWQAHVTLPLILGRQCLPSMRGFGRVVNITSAPAGAPINQPHYGCVKTALTTLTRSMARSWGPRGVTVNAVAPGLIDTGGAREEATACNPARWPIARIGQPRDVAGIVAFLCSDAADYITGASITVDGGRSLCG